MQYHFQPFFHNTAADHLTADSDRLDIPELSDGFDPSLLSLANGIEGRMIPYSYITERVPCGLYAVHIALTAVQDVEQLFLFTGRKLLRDIISLKKGDRYERTFYQSVAGGTEQKEQFDAMEKSTAALLKALKEADQASSEE